MIQIYRLLINLILIFSPLIILYRLLIGKEHKNRFVEKFGFFSKPKRKGNLFWFHGASVGELKSIIPLLIKLEKNKSIKQILVTSNTLSSSKVLEIYNFKKVIHQFFPIDSNLIIKRFIDYWKPTKVFFIDSEIWPNLMFFLEKKKIPIVLINARITKKTFCRWKYLSNFSKTIFRKFHLCLTANLETQGYLIKLKAKNIKYIGNLKFVKNVNEKISKFKNFDKFIKDKNIWCASNTHENEELISAQIHLNLKKKYKNLLTIVIPRHVDRVPSIKERLEKIGLIVHTHNAKKKISDKVDIYLVSSYGETAAFYNKTKNVFMGGSLIKHGGQNPLEAIRFGCKVFHGPYVSNFREIYAYLTKEKISIRIKSAKMLSVFLDKSFSKNYKIKKIQDKIKIIGNRILEQTYNEIKKT